ncbi:outer membrane protein [Helicobacter baculiformis]|uniref:Outer membrane protein n=1 Tax=Helicobacter baculiformis TaxID=427351 RepID=A0ABV7ZK03_9HELI|nr:outer membrane protein [Helicobacter baculiformis]
MLIRKTVAVCGAFACIASLSGESSGGYVEGGFQYSNFSGAHSLSSTAYAFKGKWSVGRDVMGGSYNGNLYGVDIQFGYKQFFGKKERFGLRYYGAFSGQGGSFSGISLGGLGHSYVNQPSANLFYGVGLDALFNFYEKKNRTLGVFAGVMLGGSSWLMGKPSGNASCRWQLEGTTNCVTMNQYFDKLIKNIDDSNATYRFSPTYVQFIINMGFRTNFTKHQGFEFGIRIPTINDPYFTRTSTATETSGCNHPTSYMCGGAGSKLAYTFRRNVSLYWNYVVNF